MDYYYFLFFIFFWGGAGGAGAYPHVFHVGEGVGRGVTHGEGKGIDYGTTNECTFFTLKSEEHFCCKPSLHCSHSEQQSATWNVSRSPGFKLLSNRVCCTISMTPS